ncbi:alpha/beta hydrolase-fold protein [Salegentibacter chungangensis]|uniref:Alpha/beta hydrolase-fold protein n=1 Tax=Salegentibacter chungangensis TaxID=1335724 RepID=A0ABW3NQR7_9FLAO
MSQKLVVVFFILFSVSTSFGQQINIGIRDTVHSDILEDDRPLSIYLPPSYHYKPDQHYPVLYILDGDYNFRYVAGLLELQGGISENIPEMILVGISGKGSTTYKKNCKPTIPGVKDGGNADEVLSFIEQELMPYIEKHYKSLGFNVLAGHSVGGIFIVNAALKRPELFNKYIAISPALWWEENAMNKVAKETYTTKDSLNTEVYVSLANEKRMGVKEFLEVAGPEFKFRKFERENHNSVGAPTYKWALRDIFKEWKIEKPYFESAEELEKYISKNASAFDIPLPIAEAVLYNSVVYVLKDQPEELAKIKDLVSANYPNSEAFLASLFAANAIRDKNYDEAEAILKESLEEHPGSFELYEKLAEVHLKKEQIQTAQEEINKAIRLAEDQKLRLWRIEELRDLENKIEAEVSKS